MEENSINIRFRKYSSVLGFDFNYFVKGGFWLVSSTFVTAIGGLVLSYLFANHLSKETFGQFSFLIAILGVATVFGLPAMSQTVAQASAENKDGVFKLSIVETVRWSLLGVFSLILVSMFYFFKGNNTLAIAIIVSAAAFPISSSGSFFNSFFSGKRLFNLVGLCSSSSQLISIASIGVALLYFPSLIYIALFSSWSTAFLNALFTFFAYKFVRNDIKDKKLIKVGVQLSFSQFFTIAADYFDRILVPVLLGFTSNAIYSFAIIIPNQLHGFFKMFTTLAQPKIAEINRKNFKKNLLVKSLQLELLIIVVLIFTIILTPIVFKTLFSAYQEEAVFFSQLTSLSLLYFPGNLLALGLLRKRQTKSLAQINAAYGLFTVIFLLLLVPQFGILGAVLAKIAVRFVQVVMQTIMFLRMKVDDTN